MVLRKRKGETLRDWVKRRDADPASRRYYARVAERNRFLSNQRNQVLSNEKSMYLHPGSKKVAGSKRLGVDPVYMTTQSRGHIVVSTTGKRDRTGIIHMSSYGQIRAGQFQHIDADFMKVSDLSDSGFDTSRMRGAGRKASTGRSSG